MPECEFCSIGAGEAPAESVYEDAENLAFFPLRPAATGHTLVIPKSHYTDFFDLPGPPLASLMQAVSTVGTGLRTALRPDGMNVISSAGAAASQTIFHVHVHLVPRWRDDRFGSIWPSSGPAVGQEIADRLRRELRTSRP